MVGGAGDDVYVVDVSGEVLTELADGGIDTVEASLTWTLGAELENLVLTGTAALNATGNNLANQLSGNAGNNRLDGGVGADTMSGGSGNDVYVVDSESDVVKELAGGGIDTVEAALSMTLGDELETLVLKGSANLNGTGNGLANTLTGNAGANRLDGGAGADTMSGGAGNDVYVVDNLGDRVSESAAGGADMVEASVNWTLGAELESLVLTGSAHLTGTGNGVANTLTGNAGNNRLNGMGGADTMRGGLGDDVYVVDITADSVIEAASSGVDTVESAITWTLGAHLENLTLTGSAAVNGTGNGEANVLLGNAAANVLNGGAGHDLLDGKAGSDTLIGGAGDDTYSVDVLTDMVTELAGEGVDTVKAGVSWTLATQIENLVLTGSVSLQGTGNAHDNQLTGNSAANTLKGAEGNDSLDGAAGNDNLDGGVGNDLLVGGAGADIYVFGRGWGSDSIVENDATVGAKDSVNFASGVAPGDVSFVRNGNALEVRIAGSAGDLLTLKDWYLGAAYKVEEFRFVGGAVLTAVQAESKASATGLATGARSFARALSDEAEVDWKSSFTFGLDSRVRPGWSFVARAKIEPWQESPTKKVALPRREEFAELLQTPAGTQESSAWGIGSRLWDEFLEAPMGVGERAWVSADEVLTWGSPSDAAEQPSEGLSWEPGPDPANPADAADQLVQRGERLLWEPLPAAHDEPGERVTWEPLPDQSVDEVSPSKKVALPERAESAVFAWSRVGLLPTALPWIQSSLSEALYVPSSAEGSGVPSGQEREWMELLRRAGPGCRTRRARDEASVWEHGIELVPARPIQSQVDALVQAMAGFAQPGEADVGLTPRDGGQGDPARWTLTACPLP